MIKWHPYMRFHQAAELSIFSLASCWIWHHPTTFYFIQGQGAQSTSFSQGMPRLQAACSIAMPEHPTFWWGEAPLMPQKKPSPTANPNRTPPLLSAPLFPTHQDHAPDKPACGWKSTFIGFLFQSTMPPCDTAITALRTSLPRKTWRHNLRSSTGPQVLLWHYGSTMVFYVACQGKHRLKKRERSKPFWRWKIQMCLYPKSCRTFATPRKGLI